MHLQVRKGLEVKPDSPQTSVSGLCSTAYQTIPSAQGAAWVKETSLTCLTALTLAHKQRVVEHAAHPDQRQYHLSTPQQHVLG